MKKQTRIPQSYNGRAEFSRNQSGCHRRRDGTVTEGDCSSSVLMCNGAPVCVRVQVWELAGVGSTGGPDSGSPRPRSLRLLIRGQFRALAGSMFELVGLGARASAYKPGPQAFRVK